MFPWILPTLSWMAGIGIADGRAWSFWSVWFITLCGLSGAVYKLRQKHDHTSFYWVLLVFTLGGATRMILAQSPLDPRDLRHQIKSDPVWAEIEGVILSSPQSSTSQINPAKNPSTWTTAFVEVTSLQRPPSSWVPTTGIIKVRWKGHLPSFARSGQKIRTQGVLGLLPPDQAPGLFDASTLYARRGIYFELRSDSAETVQDISPLRPQPVSWQETFQHWGMKTLSRGLDPSDPHVQSCWNMVLGSSLPIPSATRDAYLKTGTLHIFAISGLHITFLAQLLVQILRGMGCSRRVASGLVLPLIWVYTGLTGWQASAIRSSIMASVLETGVLLERPSSMLNSLAAAAFLILAWDPQQLFQTGFQLSFLVVFALGCSQDWLRRDAKPADAPEEVADAARWIPESSPSGMVKLSRAVIEHLMSALKMSLAAWLVSAPLIAQVFHLSTPISLLANLAIVPLSSLVLASCLASLLTGEISTWMCVSFNHASWFLMDLMTRLAQAMTLLPGAWFHVPDLHWDGFLLSYLLIAGTLPIIWSVSTYRIAFVTTLGLTTMASILYRTTTQSSFEVTILPIRGAGTLCIESAQRNVHSPLLLNGGNLQETTWITLPYLQTSGHDHIPEWIITHPNAANMGGSAILESHMRPSRIFMPPASQRSPAFRNWSKSRNDSTAPIQVWTAGMNHGVWEVIHPQAGSKIEKSSESALVLKASLDQIRMLILPDLPRRTQERLSESAESTLESEIVITGVANENESLTDSILEQIAPHMVIVCDQGRRWTEEGKVLFRERIRIVGAKPVFLSEWGCLRVRIRGDRAELDGYRGGYRGQGFERIEVESDAIDPGPVWK